MNLGNSPAGVPFPYIPPGAIYNQPVSNAITRALAMPYLRYAVPEAAAKPGIVQTAKFDQISLWLALRPRMPVRGSRPDPTAKYNRGIVVLRGQLNNA